MARTPTRRPEPPAPPQGTTNAATWAEWLGKLQAFQMQAVRDMLTGYNRFVASLASSRDVQAVEAAWQAALSDWMACVDGAQHEWFALSKALPEDALAAVGWRLKPGARRAGDEPHHAAPDLVEQSRLGVEMLLRPWMPAPDLDHTDEFVA